MANPLRSESAAFRMVLFVLGYFALIVIAARINRWLGLATFLILTTAAAITLVIRSRRGTGSARSAQTPTEPRPRPCTAQARRAPRCGARLPDRR